MISRLRTWGRGALEAFLAMAIYTVTLGVCMALMLLIISIEEGGPSLSIATVPLTETLILLTEGCGFTAGSLTLTIIPLLLTIGMIWLIRALVSRFGTSTGGWCLGTLTWMVMNLIILQGTQTVQVDTTPSILFKTALVFLVGYLLALVTSEGFHDWWESTVQAGIPSWLRRSVRLGLSWGTALAGGFLLMGLITLICWLALYHDAVGRLFHLARMGTASSVVTSIASLAWLPTMVIWAFSWLLADGFAIGDLASFTLWSGHAKSLPSVPLFGLFPDPVTNSQVRTLLLNIPLLAGLILGFLLLLGPRSYRLIATVRKHGVLSRTVIKRFLLATLAMVLAWLICLVISILLFALSNGALGTQRLASVGVSVSASGKMIAISLGMGLITSWIMTILAGSLLVLWNQVESHIQKEGALVTGLTGQDDVDQTRKQSGEDTREGDETHPTDHGNRDGNESKPGQDPVREPRRIVSSETQKHQGPTSGRARSAKSKNHFPNQ